MTWVEFIYLKAFLNRIFVSGFLLLIDFFPFWKTLVDCNWCLCVAGKNAGFLRVVRCRSLGSEYDSTTFKSSELGVLSYFVDVS